MSHSPDLLAVLERLDRAVDEIHAITKALVEIAKGMAESQPLNSGAPVTIQEAAPMVTKSVKHLRREVNAGRIKRVPGTHRVLIPLAEIERLRAGEAIPRVT